MRQDRTVLILAAFLTFVAMMWFLAQMGSAREKGRIARTDSNTPTGIKVFADLKEKLQPSMTVQWRRPFLTKSDLDRIDALFIVAPKIGLSSREEEFVLDWVKAGGHLILSAENDDGVSRVSRFLNKAGITDLIDETPGFKNGRPTEYEPKEDEGYLRKGEKYVAYSPVRFQDSSCLADEGRCWSREGVVEKGTVTLFLGLPPFSNAMIDRGDNRRIAARLALGTKRTAFDEYHLLVTEKTTKDLFLDPAFALPLLGMVIGLLLFFLAGGELETSEIDSRRRKKGASTWHDFGRRVLAKTLDRDGVLRDAVSRHAKFFAALAPKERESIEKITKTIENPRADEGAVMQAALRLAIHHQNWLKSKGRR